VGKLAISGMVFFCPFKDTVLTKTINNFHNSTRAGSSPTIKGLRTAMPK